MNETFIHYEDNYAVCKRCGMRKAKRKSRNGTTYWAYKGGDTPGCKHPEWEAILL